ncbi:MAG: hypothetical protein HOW73_33650 [Polyangiaceae bacterium]|nr:hypothetical protein [Polyangiaceae bacterium]
MVSSTPTTHVLTRDERDVRPAADGRRSALKGRLTVLGIGAVIALIGFARGPNVSKGDRRQAVAELVAEHGLKAKADDVVFVDGPRGVLGSAFGRARVLVRGSATMVPGPEAGTLVPAEGDVPSDIYLFEARLSPSGALLDLSGGYNLSDTTGADETCPVVLGERVAYASNSGIEGAPTVISLLDLAGQEPLALPTMGRAQNAVTNLQMTGRVGGIGRKTFVVEGDGDVAVAIENGAITVRTQKDVAQIVGAEGVVSDLPKWIVAQPTEVAQPGNLVTWSVDRVRHEIGDENMQMIKQAYFEAKDFFMKHKGEATQEEVAADISEEMGEEIGPPKREIPVDPETGWPPPPLEPWVTPSLEGEGQWNVKEDEAFYRHQPNLPPSYLTTFIRSDKMRKDTRVFILLWDPRMIELSMQAGTVEPKSATGKAGPGIIPRTPDVMKRVVAASNAGFQALHGEFGMMADGVVYLPPKPYGATVMKLRDGTTAFGTWPNDATVPDQVVSYRQNMTVMVQDEAFNPYDRTWWGGTVPGAEDKTHTVRTGICLTKEKFVGYFYGADLSPEALAQAMIQARCSYGLALDMNAGHAGLEFYKVAQHDKMPALDRGLDGKWEAEGEVPGMPGWDFRAKRLIKGMGLMSFPRYIKREARDYFYLTLRWVVPGENLPTVIEPLVENEGAWETKNLPQHGFPYAIALSQVRPDKADASQSFRVLELDPRMVTGQRASTDDAAAKTIATMDPGANAGAANIWLFGRAFLVSKDSPGKGAVRVVSGEESPGKGAAIACVHDESGMLYYAELKDAATGARGSLSAMSALLTSMGCTQQVSLAEPLALALGDGTNLARTAVHPPKSSSAVRLVRAEAAGGARFFEDTPVVPRSEWYPLQQQRIRYHKKPAKQD